MLVLSNDHADNFVALLDRLLGFVDWNVVLHQRVFFREDYLTLVDSENSDFNLFAGLGELRRDHFQGVIRHMVELEGSLDEFIQAKVYCFARLID